MSRIYIIVEYNGKWESVNGGSWRWFRVGMSKGFVVDRSINFLELEETIYDITRKAIYVRGDDNLNSDGGDALGFHDDHFGCRINEEIPFVARFVPTELLGSYEHPLQICASSTPINERITGFNPTPITGSNPTSEETVHEEVPNEDDGVDKASDDVPEGDDEVRKDVMVYPKKVMVYIREFMIAIVNILNLKRQDLFH
ncbi:hypothetical protein TIFTF001_015351 [Ficus carica]|uniref:Uncharacterized protein n=1 Tax=Ficus carica TaxID=3494 RepID=A0AA88ASA7_FICCA|nr:hypothetical protein TIFTF001_015351 [Ficus carica]